MSQHANAFATFCLGCEMLYVLDERLVAQAVPEERAHQVRVQIVQTLFNDKFLAELFEANTLYSRDKLFTLFTRVCHASVMRLNQTSMEKLYDLMLMSFKHQLMLCMHPRELLGIVLNHLDGVAAIMHFSSESCGLIKAAHRRFVQTYGSFTHGQLNLVRQTCLSLLQNKHTKVSLFLQRGIQDQQGRFLLSTSGPVPQGCQPPGQMSFFDHTGKQTSKVFKVGAYSPAEPAGSLAEGGVRGTDLGKNLFKKTVAVPGSGKPTPRGMEPASSSSSAPASTGTNPEDSYNMAKSAVQGLDFLSQLVGVGPVQSDDVFRLNLFADDDDAFHATEPTLASSKSGPKAHTITIEAKPHTSAALSKIMDEMDIQEQERAGGEGSDDPFDLLDTI